MHWIKLRSWASWVGWFCYLRSSYLSSQACIWTWFLFCQEHLLGGSPCHHWKTVFSPIQRSLYPSPITHLIHRTAQVLSIPAKKSWSNTLALPPTEQTLPISPISSESFSLLSWFSSPPLEFYLCRCRKWHDFTDTVRLQLQEGYSFPNSTFSKLIKRLGHSWHLLKSFSKCLGNQSLISTIGFSAGF